MRVNNTGNNRTVSGAKGKANLVPKERVNVSSISLDIPDGPGSADYDLNSATIFIHGEAGIGKTSLAAEFDDPLFLMFEPGGRYLNIARVPDKGQFSKWEQFIKVVDNLAKSNRYQNVVIDTADLAYELATAHVCEVAGEEWVNEGTLGYGKGFDRADAEFKAQILRITGTGRGVIFISHTKAQEFERSTGVKYQKLIPTIKDRGRRFINGFVDITGYYGYFGEERFLVIRGSDGVDAKCRLTQAFLTPKGEQVHSIPLGENSKVAYSNFVKAFENKQTDQHIISRKIALSETKAKFTGKR